MLIYQLVFGIDTGQVQCVFHDDQKASAGIGPNGEYHCFTCGAAAHDEVGFIAKYFSVSLKYAATIKGSLDKAQKYAYTKAPLEQFQKDYLTRIGFSDTIINKYFFQSSNGKLIYEHCWNGVRIGTTWFNNPTLPNYNASAEKYKYGPGVFGGMLTPYDDVQKYPTLIICEGEKDMLTAKSLGIPNAVAKLGGAKTYIVGGLNLENKNVVLIYDCDVWGREGMEHDAQLLTERFKCKVKIIDLGLQNAEDLNDYFIKYKKTPADLYALIKQTPVYILKPQTTQSKLQKILSGLSQAETDELVKLVNERKGENTNE